MSIEKIPKQPQGRKFKVSLGEKDSQYLKTIADQLGVSESEVMRRGLQLMALYAKTQQDETGESAIIVRDGTTGKELLVL